MKIKSPAAARTVHRATPRLPAMAGRSVGVSHNAAATHTAKARDRLRVSLSLAGLIDGPQNEGKSAHEGRQRQREEQRGGEHHGVRCG
jgi:hypothetical protein